MNKIIVGSFLLFFSILCFGDIVTPENCVNRDVISTPELINNGHILFKNETFNGNSRTCQTCHREEHNFTIDTKFISQLSKNDPLFVFERVPALSELENGFMLRKYGLITENLDGFDRPGVLRSTPHLLGLSQTMGIGVIDNVTGLPVAETGWGADGAPGDGSLRCFALGAIIQHFPKSLNRVPGVDFRYPTDEELDALLAFQLSLGRQESPVFSTMNFIEPSVKLGRDKFFGINGQALLTRENLVNPKPNPPKTRTCSGCHSEAGANNSKTMIQGRNRITNVNTVSSDPTCITDRLNAFPLAPADGGFGKTDTFEEDINCRSNKTLHYTFIGDFLTPELSGFFNVPSLIEAADTPPFFHNNAFNTIERSVQFYTSDEFNNSAGNVGRAFIMTNNDIIQISNFLRVINILENIRSAKQYVLNDNLQLAKNDVIDAINDLNQMTKSKFGGAYSTLINIKTVILIPSKKNYVLGKLDTLPGYFVK